MATGGGGGTDLPANGAKSFDFWMRTRMYQQGVHGNKMRVTWVISLE